MKSLSRGRLALSPGRRRTVREWNPTQLLAYHRCTAEVRTAVLRCCRCGLVCTYLSAAVVLLWWVGRWVLGGGGSVRDVGAGPILATALLLRAVLPYALAALCCMHCCVAAPVFYGTYCCTAVLPERVGRWVVGGWWMHCVVLCELVDHFVLRLFFAGCRG